MFLNYVSVATVAVLEIILCFQDLRFMPLALF